MPRPVIESNSEHLYPRERAPPVSLDWIDGKNVRLLRVANHREAFRFKKLSQALSTIENLHKACWLREEKRVRQSLRRLASVSPPCSSRTLFKRSSDACSKASVHGHSGLELPPCVAMRGGGGGGGGGGEEGSVAPVQSQQSTAMASPRSGYKGLLPTLPNAPLTSLTPAVHDTPCSTTPPTSRRSSVFPSSLMMGAGGTEMGTPGPLLPTPSLLALLPPHLSPELHGLQEAVLGFPLLQKRVRELIAHARQVEQQRQDRRSVALKPLEALRCRYLRLSESNISTLLELCKESGVDVDIHPHMKDSDIDISNLFKNLSSPSASTELM